MDKVHLSSPEAVVFLKLAARSMEDYRAENDHYPYNWVALGMAYKNGPFRLGDPDAVPPPDTGANWQPVGSHFSYRLSRDDERSRFRIDALAPDGHEAYYIRSGMDEPVKIDP